MQRSGSRKLAAKFQQLVLDSDAKFRQLELDNLGLKADKKNKTKELKKLQEYTWPVNYTTSNLIRTVTCKLERSP